MPSTRISNVLQTHAQYFYNLYEYEDAIVKKTLVFFKLFAGYDTLIFNIYI